MAELDTIIARFRADTREFVAGMERAARSTERLAPAARGAENGTRLLRHSLTSLAITSLDVDPKLGRLVAVLGLMGAGSVAITGVAAGLALVGLAIKALQQDALEAQQALDALTTSLSKLGPHGALVAERIKLAALESKKALIEQAIAQEAALTGDVDPARMQQLVELEQQLTAQRMALTHATEEWQKQTEPASAAQAALAKIVADAQLALAKYRVELELHGQPTQVVARAVDFLVLRMQGLSEAAARAVLRLRELAGAYRAVLPMNPFTAGANVLGRGNLTPGMQGAPTGDQVIPSSFLGVGGEPGASPYREWQRQQRAKLEPLVQSLGQELGRAFTLAMAQGIEDFSDLIKATLFSIFGTLLQFGISTAIGAAFGGPAGAIAGGAAGTGVHADVVGGGRPTMLLPPVPAMIHPYDAAKMAEWQATFRETALVASSQGFRFA